MRHQLCLPIQKMQKLIALQTWPACQTRMRAGTCFEEHECNYDRWYIHCLQHKKIIPKFCLQPRALLKPTAYYTYTLDFWLFDALFCDRVKSLVEQVNLLRSKETCFRSKERWRAGTMQEIKRSKPLFLGWWRCAFISHAPFLTGGSALRAVQILFKGKKPQSVQDNLHNIQGSPLRGSGFAKFPIK